MQPERRRNTSSLCLLFQKILNESGSSKRRLKKSAPDSQKWLNQQFLIEFQTTAGAFRSAPRPMEIQLDLGNNKITPGFLPGAWQTLPGGNVQHVVGLRQPSTVPTSHCDIACGVWKDYILSEHTTSPMPENGKGSNHPASMRGTKYNPKYKPKALAAAAAAAGSSFPSEQLCSQQCLWNLGLEVLIFMASWWFPDEIRLEGKKQRVGVGFGFFFSFNTSRANLLQVWVLSKSRITKQQRFGSQIFYS